MTKAVGIFGSEAAAAKLHAKFRNDRVHLERQNFLHPDDILVRLAEEPDIAAVLLVERALKAHNPNVCEALECLRTGDPTVRIVFIRDSPERDVPFERWCYERGIYDVCYPDRQSDVNIDAIRDTILLGRIDPDNPPPPVENPDTQCPPPAQNQGENSASRPQEWKLPSLSEFARRFKRENTRRLRTAPSLEKRARNPQSSTPDSQLSTVNSQLPTAPSIRTIGIINCSRGFGATSLTVGMAGVLIQNGYCTAATGMDFSPDLDFSGLQEEGVTVLVPSGDGLPDWDALLAEHDIILMDFGAIYEFLPSGGVVPAQSSASMAIAVREAMQLCDLRIYLASDEPWHKRKAAAFESDQAGFVLLRQEADPAHILQTIGVI